MTFVAIEALAVVLAFELAIRRGDCLLLNRLVAPSALQTQSHPSGTDSARPEIDLPSAGTYSSSTDHKAHFRPRPVSTFHPRSASRSARTSSSAAASSTRSAACPSPSPPRARARPAGSTAASGSCASALAALATLSRSPCPSSDLYSGGCPGAYVTSSRWKPSGKWGRLREESP